MDQCCFPRCKYPSSVIYIGRDLCNKHWCALCETDSETENSLLKKIGLIRDGDGDVVRIKR